LAISADWAARYTVAARSKGVPMPRLAANLAFLFGDRPFLERFGAAAAAGFNAVEIQAHYDQAPSAVRAQLDRHRLTILGINTAGGRPGEIGLAAVPGREEEFAEVFRQALDYAVAIGAISIHCLAGTVPPERRPAAEKVFIDNLTRAADVAAARDVKLLIEPINPRDRPDYFLTRVEQAADLIGRIDRPNVKIQFDFYHVQIVGGDLLRRFERHQPVIGHVQIAAVPSRAEPDEGEVNYRTILAELDRLGYAGWIGCEYKPRGRTEDGLGWARGYGVQPRAR
jgi:2-dehydrotetronate isomerase